MSFFETINKNKEHFVKFNDTKYERFQGLFPKDLVKKVINSIPLLLSLNDKKIPGYVEGKVPLGIVNYEPSEEIKKYIHSKFRISIDTLEIADPFVEMLAVMGSVGTIAYTKKSDFDYWVCVDKRKVSKEMLANFQEKIDIIQQWAMTETKVEVHLFVNDIQSLKNNIFAEDEEEAFGSTMGALLKDEFYRSSIIIAGKIPLWWVVPRVPDNEYRKIFDALSDEMKEKEYVDLGNLYEISREDFLGAALFQLVKALGSPFKSILKIGVLEKYLFAPDNSPLLSQKLKSNILRGKIDNSLTDSYILMFTEVYQFYKPITKDKTLLHMLRQNIYLKINPQLSKYSGMLNKTSGGSSLPYSVRIMQQYTEEWRWKPEYIAALDNFDNWDYNKVQQLWNPVKKFMLERYQRILKEFPKFDLRNKISDSDFKLLNRKIRTNFIEEEDEIDRYITFTDTPHQSILYIEPREIGIKEVEWKLNKSITSEKGGLNYSNIKTESDLVKLLAWTSINKIFDPTFSRMQIKSGFTRINQNLVKELLTEINNIFAEEKNPEKNEYFLNEAFSLVNMVIINFNLENAEVIHSVYHLYRNSWGKAYIKKYKSEAAIVQILEMIIQDGTKLKKKFEEYCSIVSPESHKKIYKNMEKLFRDTYEFIVTNQENRSLRLITRINTQYVVISRDGDMVTTNDHHPNFFNMLISLSLKPKGSIHYKFYGEDERIQILEQIYSSRKENSITIVYEEIGEFVFLYIINEKGNIFTFIRPQKKKEEVLVYAYAFSKNVIQQVNDIDDLPKINKNISVFRFKMDKHGNRSFENESGILPEILLSKYQLDNALNIQISKYMAKEPMYSVKKADNEYSEFLPGKPFLEKVRSVVNTESGKLNIIQDITFNDLKKNDLKLGTTLLYRQKYVLEMNLDRM
ncbi:MAG: hypothetical protein GY754_40705 [bacterium]|nr:hypothetical protein [bacterium]